MSECNGCGLCLFVCPTNSIEIKYEERGAIYYRIGEGCINCGKCEEVCPINIEISYPAQKIFYRAITKNKSVLKKSSSGGLAYEISKRFILDGGVVYGAGWDVEQQTVRHMCIDNVDDLAKIQGSLYVQSYIDNVFYKSILKNVEKGPVLMTGCPCQIAAVRSITNDHPNLICLDLICHGVPSAKLLNEQLSYISKKQILSLRFRKGTKFQMEVINEDKTYCKSWEYIPYYSLFMHFASLRESCYKCMFASVNRIGDITVGDYEENGIGYSGIVSSTVNGKKMIKKISNDVEFEEREIRLLLLNHAFSKPTVKHKRTEKFTNYYEKYGLIGAYYMIFFDFHCKMVIKKILGESNYQVLRKITTKKAKH